MCLGRDGRGGSRGWDCFSHRREPTAKDEVVRPSTKHVNGEPHSASQGMWTSLPRILQAARESEVIFPEVTQQFSSRTRKRPKVSRVWWPCALLESRLSHEVNLVCLCPPLLPRVFSALSSNAGLGILNLESCPVRTAD